MPVPNRMIMYTFICFMLTALTGIWLRLFVFTKHVHVVDYTHILHAHSHIAILGWTFLAALLIFLALQWKQLVNKTHAKIVMFTTFLVSICLFIAFIYEGYAMYSIILSTVHIFVQYWAIVFIAVCLKRNRTMPAISKLFIKGGLITLFISSIGPFALGGIAAQGLRESPLFEMAIYFYLHFQYNGWLYFMLIGLFIYMLHKNGISLPNRLLKISFWMYVIALFPAYFLSVLWYDFGFVGSFFAVIGAVGQLVGVSLFCYVLWRHQKELRQSFSTFVFFMIGLSLLFLIVKSVLELGLLFPYLADIVYDTRNVVIGYLHLTLLGFISTFIIVQFQITAIISSYRKWTVWGILLFLSGFILNEAVLFLSGLFSMLHLGYIPFSNELLLLASTLLFVGIIFMAIRKRPE